MLPKPPYLVAAFFCDKILSEVDGVVSAIRIVDRIFVHALAQEGKPETQQIYLLTLFLSFKRGDYSGGAKVRIVPCAPTGEASPNIIEQEIKFPDQPNTSANLIAQMALSFKHLGVYWFDIYLNDELITRTPLDVQLAPVPPATKKSE